MATDAEILKVVRGFRAGILAGDKPHGKCLYVSLPLASYLRFCLDLDAKMVGSIVQIDARTETNHFWIELSDGRVIDPTASQFRDMRGCSRLPEIYFGKPHPTLHPATPRIIPGKRNNAKEPKKAKRRRNKARHVEGRDDTGHYPIPSAAERKRAAKRLGRSRCQN